MDGRKNLDREYTYDVRYNIQTNIIKTKNKDIFM
jgi:hypothetical protein